VVICVERGANLHMAQLMPLPLTVSCFSKIQICFTFLVPAYPGSPGKRAVKRVCVCVYYDWTDRETDVSDSATVSVTEQYAAAACRRDRQTDRQTSVSLLLLL